MQIPHCVHPEIAQEGIVRCSSPTTGGGAQAVGNATREPDRRRAPHAGPCAYAGIDSAQVFGIAGGRVHEGKECDPHRPNVYGEAEKLHG